MLLILYSAGVVMIFGTFLLLYRHARTALVNISPAEAVDMRFAARDHAAARDPVGEGRRRIKSEKDVGGLFRLQSAKKTSDVFSISALLGAVSVFIAAVGYLGNWDALAAVAGGIYFLMGPLHGWNGHRSARAKERVVGA